MRIYEIKIKNGGSPLPYDEIIQEFKKVIQDKAIDAIMISIDSCGGKRLNKLGLRFEK